MRRVHHTLSSRAQSAISSQKSTQHLQRRRAQTAQCTLLLSAQVPLVLSLHLQCRSKRGANEAADVLLSANVRRGGVASDITALVFCSSLLLLLLLLHLSSSSSSPSLLLLSFSSPPLLLLLLHPSSSSLLFINILLFYGFTGLGLQPTAKSVVHLPAHPPFFCSCFLNLAR